ncbi:MAG: enolase C-terminal domain-like protein, partial [Acidobacteriaceae bacterium]
MNDLKIINARVIDLRFPTSRESIGSDAVNVDPDYSAAYCILETEHGPKGYGLTFTLGRGTELCAEALRYLTRFAVGRELSSITDDLGAFYRQLTSDSQFRWLGPEKGVIHLATSALLNAVWDLYARVQGKPLWKLLADMDAEDLVRTIDFRYITDALTPDEAISLLRERRPGMEQRVAQLQTSGYPAYTTSAGWFGFSDEKILHLCDEGLAQGWTHFKLKVGGTPEEDLRRARLVRSRIGPKNKLMMDANQKWDVTEAIDRM